MGIDANEIVMDKTKHLIKEGVCINLLVEYIQFQLSPETRENADKSAIEKAVKMTFDAMLNNGDVSISSWEIVNKKLTSATYLRTKDIKFKREKNYTLDLVETINSFNTFGGNSVSTVAELSTEDISNLNIALDNEFLSAMLLVETAAKLIDRANISLAGHKTQIKQTSTEVIGKYNKLFPVNFIRYVERSI